MGFVWKHDLASESINAWRLTLVTRRRWYHKAFWDEQITAFYLDKNATIVKNVNTYRDFLREDLEQIIFVAHVADGEIIQVNKDDRLDSYWFVAAGKLYWLANDYLSIVQEYISKAHSHHWLIEQIHSYG